MWQVCNLKHSFKIPATMISSHFDPDFIGWDSSIVPCQFSIFFVLVQHWFDEVRDVFNISNWCFNYVTVGIRQQSLFTSDFFHIGFLSAHFFVSFHSLCQIRCLSKISFVFCAGSSWDHMLFSWLGLACCLKQLSFFLFCCFLYFCALLLNFIFCWPPLIRPSWFCPVVQPFFYAQTRPSTSSWVSPLSWR